MSTCVIWTVVQQACGWGEADGEGIGLKVENYPVFLFTTKFQNAMEELYQDGLVGRFEVWNAEIMVLLLFLVKYKYQ